MAIAYWYGALSQRTYPKVGDIDDCWVVASIWAVRYQTHQSARLPDCTTFRVAAGNPDDPYRPDGGNHNQINQAIDRLWPTVPNIHYASKDWAKFVAHLKKGASATVATKSSLLPSNCRFGFYGPHQIAVVYRAGAFRVMNPLAKTGSAPIAISEAALKRAVLGLNGWVMAVIIPAMNLGTVKKGAGTFFRYTRTVKGTWVRRADVTKGFSGACTPPKTMTVYGASRKMVLVTTGSRAGFHVALGSGMTFAP